MLLKPKIFLNFFIPLNSNLKLGFLINNLIIKTTESKYQFSLFIVNDINLFH